MQQQKTRKRREDDEKSDSISSKQTNNTQLSGHTVFVPAFRCPQCSSQGLRAIENKKDRFTAMAVGNWLIFSKTAFEERRLLLFSSFTGAANECASLLTEYRANDMRPHVMTLVAM